jgi:aconitase A
VRRNVVAALVQLLGIAVVVAGSFAVSWKVGVVAIGVVVLLVGLDLEGDA